MFPEITSRLRSLLAAPPPLSIFGGPSEEKTVTSFEAITTDWYARNGYNQIYEALGGSGASWSGERVNLASALNHSVVWACNAITAAAAAEATYSADVTNVATIETAIATATAPLTAAQTQATTDATAFNASLDALSEAALAAKVATS